MNYTHLYSEIKQERARKERNEDFKAALATFAFILITIFLLAMFQ